MSNYVHTCSTHWRLLLKFSQYSSTNDHFSLCFLFLLLIVNNSMRKSDILSSRTRQVSSLLALILLWKTSNRCLVYLLSDWPSNKRTIAFLLKLFIVHQCGTYALRMQQLLASCPVDTLYRLQNHKLTSNLNTFRSHNALYWFILGDLY